MAVGGCLGRSSSGGSDASVTGIETRYPGLPPTKYDIDGNPVDSVEGTPVEFETLSSSARLEAANAIARTGYVTDESPALLADDTHSKAIAYKGTAYEVEISVADAFRDFKLGPEEDPNWRKPVTVDASVRGTELTVSLTNDLDIPLTVHHYGRPYFGVLLAVGESTTLLGHSHYEENPTILTDGTVRATKPSQRERQTSSLSPESAIEDSYTLPELIPDNSQIWLSLRIGDESIDQFNNRWTTLTAILSLST